MLYSNRFPSHSAQPGRENPDSTAPEEDLADQLGQPEFDDSEGSWKSHLGYGLGVAAVLAPCVIPGPHHAVLWIVYFSLAVAFLMSIGVWGIIQSIRGAILIRRVQRREFKRVRAS